MHDDIPAPGMPVSGRPTVVAGTPRTPRVVASAIWTVVLGLAFSGYFTYIAVVSGPAFGPNYLVPLSMVAVTVVGILSLVKRGLKLRDHVESARLEVTDDRIFLCTGGTFGREWRKSNGSLVTVTGRNKRMTMSIGSTANTPVSLREFDVMEIRAACLAHGWSWKQGGAPVLEPVPAQVARHYGGGAAPESAEPEVDLVLKAQQGNTDAAKIGKWFGILAPFATSATFGLTLWLYLAYELEVMWLPFVVLGAGIGLLVTLVIRSVRSQELVVTISRSRLSVRRGNTVQVIDRVNLDGPGTIDKRYAKFGAEDVRFWMPIHTRREEILAQLSAHGWELVDKK